MKLLSYLQKRLYERRLQKCGLQFPIRCKIHGVSSPDRQGALAQSRKGDRLQIVHTPVKGYPFNVYVYNISLNRILGYLDSVLAEQLVYLFRSDFCKDAVLEQITGGAPSYAYFGCTIKILETSSFITDETFSHLHGD